MMMEIDTTADQIGKMPRRFAIAATTCAAMLLASLGAVHASYFNPTSAADCNIRSDRYQFNDRFKTIRHQSRQCHERFSGEPRWKMSSCHWDWGPYQCHPVFEQTCNLLDQMETLRQSCMAKLEIYQQQEQARKQRENALRREQEEAQRLARQAARDMANFQSDTARIFATDDIRPSLKRPVQIAEEVLIGGKRYIRRTGIPVSTQGGAQHLSDEVSKMGLRYIQSVHENALRRLEAATERLKQSQRNHMQALMLDFAEGGSLEAERIAHERSRAGATGPYSHDNPMPTQAAQDRTREQIMDLVARTADLEGDLPFGNESAVVGENAKHLTEIARARAEGRMDVPINQIKVDDAVAAVRRGSNIASSAGNQALRQQRTAVLGEIRTSIAEQKRRIAAAEAKRRRDVAEAERKQRLEAERRRQMAVQLERQRQRNIAAQNAAKIRELQRRMEERQDRIDRQRRIAEAEKRRRNWENLNNFMNGLVGAAGAVGSAYVNGQQGGSSTYRGPREKCGSVAHGTVC